MTPRGSKALEKCRVHVSQRIVDAMVTLERGNAQIALVTDDLDRLVGTLTDGDLRRALLGGATLASPIEPHVHREFISAPPEAGRAQVLDLMQARRVAQIPVIDAEGRLRGLHLLHEMLGPIERPNWAVVMAGGRGTRLLPLTSEVPKPMLPVAGRPILERIVLHLVGHGVRRIFLAVSYLAEVIERHFGDGRQLGCRIEYLRERRPLGTGGALSLLPEPPSAPLVVVNGDLVTQFDLARAVAFHEEGRFAATVGAHRYSHTVPFGVLEVRDRSVVGLREKPTVDFLANAGIYILDPGLVARVPRDEELALPSLIEGCLERGEPVGAFPVEGDWIDVGRAPELRRARGEGEE